MNLKEMRNKKIQLIRYGLWEFGYIFYWLYFVPHVLLMEKMRNGKIKGRISLM